MMKRMSFGQREENYEHVLMCLICRSLFDDASHQPKFLPCHHTFCKECLRDYVQQIGDDIECPSCRKVATIPAAGVAALQTNFYVKYIQSLVQGSWMPENSGLECCHHVGKKVQYYCHDCCRSVCSVCCSTATPTVEEEGEGDQSRQTQALESINGKYNGCGNHLKVPITTVTEDYHQKLDTSFSRANSIIEKKKDELEAMLNALSKEKDDALLMIDSKFESHVHALNRRATLLKNKVIDIYKGQVEKLELGIDQVSWAMTAIVSLKEYHEKDIARGYFTEVEQGIFELDEVSKNILERVNPTENHIVFDGKHGIEKYNCSVRDLGRVQYSKPRMPRAEPDGGDLVTPPQSASATACSSAEKTLSNPDGCSPDFGAVGGGGGGMTPDIPGDIPGVEGGAASCYEAPESHRPPPPSPERTRALSVKKESVVPDSNGNDNDLPTIKLEMKIDPNSNAIAATGAVRPKTLSSELKKNGKVVVRPKTKVSSTNKLPKTIPYLVQPGEELPGKMGVAPQLHLSDINLNKDDSKFDPALKPHLSDKVNQGLKTERDKLYTYHHLVYTSYDEEELLKELKSGHGSASIGQMPQLGCERQLED